MGNVIIVRKYGSPAGELILGSFEGRLCMCDWASGKGSERSFAMMQRVLDATFVYGTSEVVDKGLCELEEYFSGKRESFDIPLLFIGTDFQKTVWNYLLTIPYGKTISYGEMARQLGMPKSVRALANAVGANRISILAPCHRVIGSDSSIVGYRGGISAKIMLLDLESAEYLLE